MSTEPSLLALIQHPSVTIDPMPTPPMADPDNVAALQRLVERLEAQLTPRGPTMDEDWYGWIPLPIATFLENMHSARHLMGPGRHSFLDIGSGIGTKLILAHELGFEAHGVERWPAYANTSRQIAPFAEVRVCDAAQLGSYHAYDLVYLYGIATSQAEHDRINRQITSRMRRGALFFCARQPFPAWLEHLGGLIWRA
jgi:hypothetical protein